MSQIGPAGARRGAELRSLVASSAYALSSGRLAFAREVILVGAAYFAYLFTRRLVFHEDSAFVAYLNAENLVRFEKALFNLWETQFQRWMIDHALWLIQTFNWLYMLTFWPIIASAAIFMFYTNRGRYVFYRNAFLLTFGIALVVFAIFPLAPPRMMAYHGFVDSALRFGPSFLTSHEAQSYYNAYAAMPSLHFGWTFLIGIMFWNTGPWWLKAAGVLYPSVTFLTIVGTGNHYMLDAVGGAAVVVVAMGLYWLASRAANRAQVFGAPSSAWPKRG